MWKFIVKSRSILQIYSDWKLLIWLLFYSSSTTTTATTTTTRFVEILNIIKY